jgi:dihydroorotate dehydrogenase
MYEALKPLLFRLPPERAHGLALGALGAAQDTPVEDHLRARYRVDDDRLTVEAMGLEFPTPVGVAAGFDKNAVVPRGLAALGFGHVEVGGVTAERQPGNPRPRLFRLPEDRALVNRMGFNNEGADAVGDRLVSERLPDVPVGVNIGKSKSAPLESAEEDYLYTFERVGGVPASDASGSSPDHRSGGGDYFVVNVSSPNTPGLRELQQRDPLERILGTLQDAGADPLLVKLSPDLAESAVEEALSVVEDLGLDGVIAVNTTTERPDALESHNRAEEGGLSGAPLDDRATDWVRFVAERVDVPVVGVGGVATAEDAYRKLRAGASVVQLYTALVYEGPGVARKINEGLLDLLERDGLDSVEDAVGADL